MDDAIKIIDRNKAVGLDCLSDNLYNSEEFWVLLQRTINSDSFRKGEQGGDDHQTINNTVNDDKSSGGTSEIEVGPYSKG